MEARRRLLWVWSTAAAATAFAWVVAEHWAGSWPAMLGVVVFLVAALTALALTFSSAPASRR